ncbi:MAG: heat-inducible transcriptional repressor HrcA [Cellulosilyticaceae bacterium]
MDMNERKIKILEAIIHDYIQTGDPVGSRTISKKYDLGISSATIRNEMSDLEDLGFIVQPHTSSGRIPSDRGYRLYVDSLMKKQDIAPDMEDIIVGMLKQKINKVDELLEETARLVSMMTNYATIASSPSITETKIKHLQLVPVDEYSVACVIVTDTNIVRHQVIPTSKPLDNHLCLVLSNILNDILKQSSLREITCDTTQILEEKMFEYKDIAVDVVGAIIKTLQEEDLNNIFTRGMTNILDFQEFNDVEKAKQILELLEEKPHLMKLLDQSPSSSVNITIGEENALEPMKQCSVITTNFRIGGYSLGSIGIIGPTRMNYGQVVSILEHIAYYITNMLCDCNDS